MTKKYKIIKITLFLCLVTFLCGCTTKINYDKIPLTVGDEPYILMPGNYMDINGFMHLNQTNVWALSQKDVFEYVKWIRDTKK